MKKKVVITQIQTDRYAGKLSRLLNRHTTSNYHCTQCVSEVLPRNLRAAKFLIPTSSKSEFMTCTACFGGSPVIALVSRTLLPVVAGCEDGTSIYPKISRGVMERFEPPIGTVGVPFQRGSINPAVRGTGGRHIPRRSRAGAGERQRSRPTKR